MSLHDEHRRRIGEGEGGWREKETEGAREGKESGVSEGGKGGHGVEEWRRIGGDGGDARVEVSTGTTSV